MRLAIAAVLDTEVNYSVDDLVHVLEDAFPQAELRSDRRFAGDSTIIDLLVDDDDYNENPQIWFHRQGNVTCVAEGFKEGISHMATKLRRAEMAASN